MAKWWHVSWKRLVLLVVATYGGLWLLAGTVQLMSGQFTPWLLARDLKRENPQLSQIPIPIPDRSLVAFDGMLIEFYGVSMDIPWKEISRQKVSQSVSIWNFENGASLLVENPSEIRDLARLMRDQPESVPFLGKDILQTESSMFAAAMYSTPDGVKWWKPPAENAKAMTLAELKDIHCHNYGKLFSVGFGRMQGFQEGAPNTAPYKVVLNLFDSNDRHYQIIVTGEAGKPIPLTQAQLNSMIASIQPDPKP
jgi:hypothetical protein